MMAMDDNLDRLLSEAAAQRAEPSPGLVFRILADADDLQPKPQGWRVTPPTPRGWFATLSDWFGGSGSLVGMSAAAVAGLYLGVAQPASVLALTDLLTGTANGESLELLPSDGTLWAME